VQGTHIGGKRGVSQKKRVPLYVLAMRENGRQKHNEGAAQLDRVEVHANLSFSAG
jgi:hypothetical protein